MGFEPMPLSRLAPKASALTTRPNLHDKYGSVGRKVKVEEQGIDPCASCMQSRRSTI